MIYNKGYILRFALEMWIDVYTEMIECDDRKASLQSKHGGLVFHGGSVNSQKQR